MKKNVKSHQVKKERVLPEDPGRRSMIFNLTSAIIFILLALYLTVLHNSVYLVKLQELSLFLPTRLFLHDFLKVPGGLLSYVGEFFTQFFFYPWLGSTLLILLLLLMQYLAIRAFKVPRSFYPVTFIFSLALLLVITQLGYNLFYLKSRGYAFTGLVGMIIVLLSFLLYRKISLTNYRALFALLFQIIIFPAAGFYALFAGLIMVIYEGISLLRKGGKEHLLPLLTGLLVIPLVPFTWYYFIYHHASFPGIYSAGLPLFGYESKELKLWLPFIVLFISAGASLSFLFMKKIPARAALISFMVFVFAAGLTMILSYEDENFRTELAMDQALSNTNPERVLELASDLEGEPTRLIVIYTHIALNKLNRAGDKMFTYKSGAKVYKAGREVKMIPIAAKPVYFHYGKINYCYRWSMEDMVENGMKAEYLKYLVRCSIVNQEFPLARKYNDMLKRTLFHRKLALRYQELIDHPEQIALDPEFKSILPLHEYDNFLDGDTGFIEVYLLYSFARLASGSPELLELSIQANLQLKNMDEFWPRFFIYARSNERIPIHYQEAALLFSYFNKRADVSGINFDENIVTRFDKMVQVSKSTANLNDPRNEPFFYSQFGDTYWYYYFFVKELKSN